MVRKVIASMGALKLHRRINHMKNITEFIRNFAQDESGQDLIEYALVAGLIGLGAVAAMTSLSTAISTAFSNVSSRLTSAV